MNTPKFKLTDAVVRKLTLDPDMPDGKVFWDKDLPRFGVRLYRSGRKLWFCQYRFGGQTRPHTIALTTEKTADQARERAKDIFAHVRLGADPEAERQKANANAKELFGVLVEKYLHEKLRPIKLDKKPMRPRSFAEVQRHLETHCAPFSKKPIRSITKGDVAELYEEIARDPERGPGAAKHTWATLCALMNWAVHNDKLDKNVAALYDGGGASDPRERTLPDSEIAIVWKACNADQFGDIVKLLILTGARRDEIGHMHLSELDLDNKKWLLPEGRSKNRREFLFTLSEAAVNILTKAVETREAHVFGHAEKRGFSGWSKAKKAIDKRIADGGHTLDHWQLHDLRRSFASGLQRLKIEPHIIEACLNHTLPKLERTYKTYDHEPEKRSALTRWATHVDAVVTGKTIDNVVNLREATVS